MDSPSQARPPGSPPDGRRFSRPSTLVILLLGLNLIALTVLCLVIIDPPGQAGPPATPQSAAPVIGPAGAHPANAAPRPPEPAVTGRARTAPAAPIAAPAVPAPPARPLFPGAPAWLPAWFSPLGGPAVVAIQVGHLRNLELPDELRHLRGNDGAIVHRIMEWQINQKVAQALAKRLEASGVRALVLPATIPPGLRADAFLAIHCDWADRQRNHGWKVVAPARANRASRNLADVLSASFDLDRQLRRDPAAISDTLSDYYAFNRPQYRHAIDPLTPGVVIELGFMSNPEEFRLLTRQPDRYAAILERGIARFLAAASRHDLARLITSP